MKKILFLIISIVSLIQIGYFFYYTFYLINPSMVDMAGHFGSAQVFSQGYFHAYDDQNFLGYIHNLFYPPLQDFLITFISFFTEKDFVIAGKIYLFLSFCFFMVSVILFLKNFPSYFGRFLFFMFILLWLNVSRKYDTQVFQGLTFFDTLGVGLITQFLGTGILFLLINAILKRKNPYTIAILLGLCFYSHILSAIVGSIVIFFFYFFERRKLFFIGLILGIGIGAAFWLPFVVSLPYAESAILFDNNTLRTTVFFTLSLIPLVAFYLLKMPFSLKQTFGSQTTSVPVFSLISALFFFVNCIGTYFFKEHQLQLFPNFHYYRLLVYGLFFLVIDLCFSISNPFKNSKLSHVFIGVYVLNLFCLCMAYFEIDRKNDSVYNYFNLDFFNWPEAEKSQTGPMNRTLFGFNTDPNDQNIAEYLRARQINLRTANGVYWESSDNNKFFVSYNAMLFRNPSGILNFFYKEIDDCNIYACIFDQFIRDFSIKYMVFSDDIENRNTLPLKAKSCLIEKMNQKNSRLFDLKAAGKIQVSTINISNHKKTLDYTIYQVQDNFSLLKNKNPIFSQNFIEFVDGKDISFFENKDDVLSEHFESIFSLCAKNQNSAITMIPKNKKEDLFLLDNLESKKYPPVIEDMIMEKIDKNLYKIVIHSEEPIFFKIKLSYFDGLTLRNEQGQRQPLVPGVGYSVGFGHGAMTLTYERPITFALSYAIALVSFFVAFFLWWGPRHKVG